MRATLFSPLKYLTVAVLGAVLAFFISGIWYLESRPDLKIWHTVELDEEFTADKETDTFPGYLQHEQRVFEQLDEQVYGQIDLPARRAAFRYGRGNAADPDQWARNWNRTFELQAPNARAGVLLLHGISDSPYSLRAIGSALHERGATVIGLRLPGHGTAPSGLLDMTAEDLIAAVRLGMRHTRHRAAGQPLYIVGYSTGGALAVDYTLTALQNARLPQVAGIVLISPAIGVTPAAQFAVWQARVGKLLGLQKLEWNSLTVEYDPFKYGSFAVNAADVVYRLTQKIRVALAEPRNADALARMPPIIAFQSIVDATVSTPALIEGLLTHLPARGDELVLFDIDRSDQIEPLLSRDPSLDIEKAMSSNSLPFAVSLITNANPRTAEVVARHQKAGEMRHDVFRLNTKWPPDVASLSHVALPFPPDDALYGATPPENEEQLYLGELSMRGERELLIIPAADMLRLRWNPFYSYMEGRIVDFMHLDQPAGMRQSR